MGENSKQQKRKKIENVNEKGKNSENFYKRGQQIIL
jgi:hypothetical protein